MTRAQQGRAVCDVCGAGEASLVRWREMATLCALHAKVVRGILPTPQSVREIRALFPARVVVAGAARRGRAA